MSNSFQVPLKRNRRSWLWESESDVNKLIEQNNKIEDLKRDQTNQKLVSMQQNVDRNAKKLAKIHEFLNDSVDNRCQLQSGMEAEILNVKKIFLIIF